ncbi:Lrp/AsnC family transcriptional regulator [Candidatus Micrarchaeota archaeon]|nr:Lrp/AsnC family transcriptional regulator [Candidatus Micrarchaeota archaeon]
MLLDASDRKILHALHIDARVPETVLAKRLRLSRDVVHYRIRQLCARGIITVFRTWIDLGKVGYHNYKLYLKMSGDQARRSEFFDHIRSRDDVFWLGVADGAWDVGVTFFARDKKEFFDKKNELFSRFSDIIIEKKTGLLVDIWVYPFKFLIGGEGEPRTLFGDIEENELEVTDKKVLAAFMHDARGKSVTLARSAGVTVDVFRNRVKRLEDKGIIGWYAAAIDHTKLGMEFYKTFLYFDNLGKTEEAKLLEFCKSQPNIVHIVRLIGPWEIELEIMVENYAAYNKIMHELRALFPHELRNIESAVMSEDYVFPARKTVFG